MDQTVRCIILLKKKKMTWIKASLRPGNIPPEREILFQHTIIKSKKQQLLLLFAFVENRGVEPLTSCMPCKRSSQLS
jgi:hypothetical protein